MDIALPVVIAVAALIYILLAMKVGQAAARKGRAKGPWFLIAFFLGLVIPALIVAVMRPLDENDEREDTQEVKQCPLCAETIREAAIKCKHCGSDLTQL